MKQLNNKFALQKNSFVSFNLFTNKSTKQKDIEGLIVD